MTTPIHTVLFDLGGVVCRFHPERRLLALASDCGLSEREVRARIWDAGFDRDCDLGRYTADEVYRQTRQRLGLKASYEEFRRMWALAFEPDPAVRSLVDSLRSCVHTGLLTDNGPVLRDVMATSSPKLVAASSPCSSHANSAPSSRRRSCLQLSCSVSITARNMCSSWTIHRGLSKGLLRPVCKRASIARQTPYRGS
jgi:hypothetical protein